MNGMKKFNLVYDIKKERTVKSGLYKGLTFTSVCGFTSISFTPLTCNDRFV